MVLKPFRRRRAREAMGAVLLAALSVGVCHAADDDDDDSAELPVETAAHTEADTSRYTVEAAAPAGLALTPPVLPDLSPYTPEAAKAKLVRGPAGRAQIAEMLGEKGFKQFEGHDERLREWAMRQSSTPKAIFIEGYMTPHELARQLPASAFEESAPGVFVARLPLMIRPKGTLNIDKDVREFRLSQDRGSFIVNDGGDLFITDTHLLAWSEAKRGAAKFRDKHEFRPYITTWGGSRLYIVNSLVESLGYAASKAYGISITQFGPALNGSMKRTRPTGWLLNSQFVDLWYGFYCYEADDVVVRGNIYRDDIKYGIDPHDRSRRLIIAENEAYGTKEKHGIIVSREVNDSWIFNNVSHDNELSGIVLDRKSRNNIVAHNKVYQNRGNGITVYESMDSLVWQNLVTSNAQHGIYVRNSTGMRFYENAVVGNTLSGLYGLTKDLSGIPRDLKRDPYDQVLSLSVVGGKMVSNGSGPFSINNPLRAEFYDVDIRTPKRPLGIRLNGMLVPLQEQFLDILMRQRMAAVLLPTRAAAAQGKLPRPAAAEPAKDARAEPPARLALDALLHGQSALRLLRVADADARPQLRMSNRLAAAERTADGS